MATTASDTKSPLEAASQDRKERLLCPALGTGTPSSKTVLPMSRPQEEQKDVTKPPEKIPPPLLRCTACDVHKPGWS